MMGDGFDGEMTGSGEIASGLLPRTVRPIIVIGAGSIVRDAHLPAYALAGLPVVGIADKSPGQAEAVAAAHGVGRSFGTVAEAVRFAPRDCVFDLAVPAPALLEVLEDLPDGAAVLMQKPMGETLAEAKEILTVCRRKRLTAAVNFQLRWAPNVYRAWQMRQAGELGEVHDFQVEVSCRMPWETWSFLSEAPRLEMLYHSIHYLDLARAWLGEPAGVQARTVRSPRTPSLAATKSAIVLDYGDWTRALVATDHSNNYGAKYQRSFVQVEGTAAAIHARIGVNLDYPKGLPDTLELGREGDGWRAVPVVGSWFPHAFAGSMGSLQRRVEGSATELFTGVDDAVRTMVLVEAAYESSRTGAAVRLQPFIDTL